MFKAIIYKQIKGIDIKQLDEICNRLDQCDIEYDIIPADKTFKKYILTVRKNSYNEAVQIIARTIAQSIKEKRI